MRPLSIITLLVGVWLIPVNAVSQEASSQRTQEIAASFNKEKHTVKEKNGVRTEKYKRVHSEPAIKQNIADYSGVYEVSDLGYLINLQVENNGSVKAFGSEPANDTTRQPRSFRLEGAKIVGAMLTGTKVYDDGATAKFESVFINRTVFNSPADKGITEFGLGVVSNPVEFAGITFDKLFYQLKR